MIHWKILIAQAREKYFRPVIALCGSLMFSIHCAPVQYWEEKSLLYVARAVRSVGTLMGEAGAGGEGSFLTAHSSDSRGGLCTFNSCWKHARDDHLYTMAKKEVKSLRMTEWQIQCLLVLRLVQKYRIHWTLSQCTFLLAYPSALLLVEFTAVLFSTET